MLATVFNLKAEMKVKISSLPSRSLQSMAEIDIWLIQEQKDSETPKMSSSPTSWVRVFLVKEEADWILEDD